MVQKIIRKYEIVVQRSHVSLVLENKKLTDLKQFASHPWHPKTEEDYFMYSIHNMVKDEAQNQHVEEKLIDIMYMFDDIPYIDNSTKYDKVIVEIDVDCSKQLVAHGWEEELQLQLKDGNQ